MQYGAELDMQEIEYQLYNQVYHSYVDWDKDSPAMPDDNLNAQRHVSQYSVNNACAAKNRYWREGEGGGSASTHQGERTNQAGDARKHPDTRQAKRDKWKRRERRKVMKRRQQQNRYAQIYGNFQQNEPALEVNEPEFVTYNEAEVFAAQPVEQLEENPQDEIVEVVVLSDSDSDSVEEVPLPTPPPIPTYSLDSSDDEEQQVAAARSASEEMALKFEDRGASGREIVVRENILPPRIIVHENTTIRASISTVQQSSAAGAHAHAPPPPPPPPPSDLTASLATERAELLQTPDSGTNDFIQTDLERINKDNPPFNFQLHEYGLENMHSEILRPARKATSAPPNDLYETESSCSEIGNNPSETAPAFSDLNFESRAKDIFSGPDLSSFSNFITPNRSRQKFMKPDRTQVGKQPGAADKGESDTNEYDSDPTVLNVKKKRKRRSGKRKKRLGEKVQDTISTGDANAMETAPNNGGTPAEVPEVATAAADKNNETQGAQASETATNETEQVRKPEESNGNGGEKSDERNVSMTFTDDHYVANVNVNNSLQPNNDDEFIDVCSTNIETFETNVTANMSSAVTAATTTATASQQFSFMRVFEDLCKKRSAEESDPKHLDQEQSAGESDKEIDVGVETSFVHTRNIDCNVIVLSDSNDSIIVDNKIKEEGIGEEVQMDDVNFGNDLILNVTYNGEKTAEESVDKQPSDKPLEKSREKPVETSENYSEMPSEQSFTIGKTPEKPIVTATPTQKSLVTGKQLPEKSVTTGNQLPEKSVATGKQFPEKSLATGKQLPEISLATGKQLPEKSVTTGKQLPQQSLVTEKQLPEKSLATGKQLAEKSVATGKQLPEKSLAVGKQLSVKSLATEKQLAEKSVATGRQLPEKSIATGKQPPERSQVTGKQALVTGKQLPEKSVATAKPLPEKSLATGKQLPEKALVTIIPQEKFLVNGKPSEKSLATVILPEKPLVTGKPLEKPIATAKPLEKSVATEKLPDRPIAAGKHPDKPIATGKPPDNPIAAGNPAEKSLVTDKPREKSLVTGNRSEISLVTGKSSEKSLVSGKSLEQPVVAGKPLEKSLVPGNISGKSLVCEKSAEKSLVSRNAPGQSLVTGKPAEKSLVTGKSPRKSVVIGKAQGKSRGIGKSPGKTLLTRKTVDKSLVTGTPLEKSLVTGKPLEKTRVTGKPADNSLATGKPSDKSALVGKSSEKLREASDGKASEPVTEQGECSKTRKGRSKSRKKKLVKNPFNVNKGKSFSDFWTPDMKKFYDDSWGQESYDMEKELSKMSSDPAKWKIIPEDMYKMSPRRVGPRCVCCKEFGHPRYQCPKQSRRKCSLCGGAGHFHARCPNLMCTTCGRKGGYHTTSCSNCFNYVNVKCSVCHMMGHIDRNCPDLWRRYHITKHNYQPRVSKLKLKAAEQRWCSGCAKRGHFQHECGQSTSEHFRTLPNAVTYEPSYNTVLHFSQIEPEPVLPTFQDVPLSELRSYKNVLIAKNAARYKGMLRTLHLRCQKYEPSVVEHVEALQRDLRNNKFDCKKIRLMYKLHNRIKKFM